MSNITFNDFKKHLEDVQNIHDIQVKLYDFSENHNFKIHIELPILIDNVVELLSKATDDTEDLIGYWVFELDFGRKATELGSDLITVENLWDKLHKKCE